MGVASSTPGLEDGYHEIIEPPPASPAVDPLAGTSTDPSERYYNQAGVKIMLTGTSRSNPTVSIYDAAGNQCTSTSAVGSTDLAIYNTFHSAITTTATLQDARQNATIHLTTLNISNITSALNGSLYGHGCNIVYLDDKTANPSGGVNCGVELINGYNMPSGGLTVVSDNPVYIQGDYNTASTSANIANVPSNASYQQSFDSLCTRIIRRSRAR